MRKKKLRTSAIQIKICWFILAGFYIALMADQAFAAQPGKKKGQPSLNPVQVEVLRGHGGAVQSVVFHPSGTTLYSGGHDAQVIGWNIEKAGPRKGECFEIDRRQSGERVSSLAFNRTGDVFAMSGTTHWGNGFGSALKIFTPFQEDPFKIGAAAKWSYTSCDIDPRGRFVVMGAKNNQLRAVALTTKVKKKRKRKEVVPALARIDAPGVPCPVLRVACHPKQSAVAAGGKGGWIGLYRVTANSLVKASELSIFDGSRDDRILGLKFTTDGRELIAACEDQSITVYSVKTGSQIRKFSPVDSTPLWIDAHPKYSWIVVGYEDGVARIMDYDAGRVIAELRGHDGPVKAAAFSPNGKGVATGGEDQTVRLWDLQIAK